MEFLLIYRKEVQSRDLSPVKKNQSLGVLAHKSKVSMFFSVTNLRSKCSNRLIYLNVKSCASQLKESMILAKHAGEEAMGAIHEYF